MRAPLLGALALVSAVFLRVYAAYYARVGPIPLFGAPQEIFLELQVGQKFAQCGPLRTAFLPDYSAGGCQEPPLLYTHQVPFPSLALAGLLKLGLAYPAVRLPYMAAALLGLLFFVGFCEAVTGSAAAAAAAGVYAVCSFGGFLVWSDHCVHSLFWLSYFGSMFFFTREEDSAVNRAGRLLFLTLGFGISFMWATSILATQGLFTALDRDPRSFTRFKQSLAACAAFAAVLLVRNGVHLGWGVALKDALYTLSNRIRGVPSRQDLAAFYKAHGLVLWGVERLDAGFLFGWLGAILSRCRYFLLVLAASAALQWRAQGLRARPWKYAAVAAGLFCWYLIFAALGQHYPLPYLIRTTEAVLLAGSCAELAALGARKAGAGLLALALLADPLRQTAASLRNPVDDRAASDQAALRRGLESLRTIAPNEIVWTNLDAPLVRYYSQGRVLGSCKEQAFERRDPALCYGEALSSFPDYFFLSTRLIPGGLACQKDCVKELVVRLQKELPAAARSEGDDWWLFSLSSPRSDSGSIPKGLLPRKTPGTNQRSKSPPS